MGLRTALSQARWVTFGVLLAAVWTLLTAHNVLLTMQSPFAAVSAPGQTADAGLVGALVMAALLALLLGLYGELAESTPTPQSWPPER